MDKNFFIHEAKCVFSNFVYFLHVCKYFSLIIDALSVNEFYFLHCVINISYTPLLHWTSYIRSCVYCRAVYLHV